MCQLKEGKGQPDYWEEPFLSAVELKSRGLQAYGVAEPYESRAHGTIMWVVGEIPPV